MAIDTAAKRISALDMGNEITSGGMPFPDATIDDSDRRHLLYLYSDIAADPPPVSAGGGMLLWMRRRRKRR